MSVLEERLFEAAAIGDLDAVKAIVQTGKANVNHQHKVRFVQTSGDPVSESGNSASFLFIDERLDGPSLGGQT